MFELQKITNDPFQQQNFTLFDGSTLSMSFRFVPMQQGWFIDELVWQDFVLKGFRIVNSPNMLHQFKNQISFGLGCFSKDDKEPSLQEDFLLKTSTLFILDESEVQTFVEIVNGEISI